MDRGKYRRGFFPIGRYVYFSYGASGYTDFLRMHNTTIETNTGSSDGFFTDLVRKSYFDNLKISVTSNAIWLWNSDNNILENIYLSGRSSGALTLSSGSNHNIVKSFYLFNSGTGLNLDSSNNIYVQGLVSNTGAPAQFASSGSTPNSVTVVNNNTDDGLCINSNSSNTIVNPMIMNHSNHAIYITSGSNNQIFDLTSYVNQSGAIYVHGSNNYFRGSLSLGGDGGLYDVLGSGNELDNSCLFGPSISETPQVGIDLSNSFFG
ncbi:MAG: hypothetical protein IPK68_03590 [Bdellovibrionales bacterium]|nr:hypothetical protein [Bdellovibrionales bacterium]